MVTVHLCCHGYSTSVLSWLQYKPKTLNPVWLEQFNLHMFDDQTSHLEISVWDHDAAGKDDIMGRSVTRCVTIL